MICTICQIILNTYNFSVTKNKERNENKINVFQNNNRESVRKR